MNVTAIIPARGGSKGIPEKNLVPVLGSPLIAWTLRDVARSSLITRCIVTTDDDSIASYCRAAGAQIFFRDPETATDGASSESAIIEVIHSLRLRDDLIVFLQATSPCRERGELDRAIAATAHCDSLFAAVELQGYVWRLADHGPIRVDRSRRLPRQVEPLKYVEETGSYYIFGGQKLLTSGSRTHGDCRAFLQNSLCRYQVDEPGDIPIVEWAMEALNA